MVELQVVVLAVAGSSPVDHPFSFIEIIDLVRWGLRLDGMVGAKY